MIQINLHRHCIGDTATHGTLSIEGNTLCHTTEHTLHRPPTGLYRIELHHLRSQRRKVPVLIAVNNPGRIARVGASQPYIGIGNGIYHRHDGCILVGTYVAPGCLKQGRAPFMLLYDRINKALRRGHEVMLRITEAE